MLTKEELFGTYIEYDSLITEEIFNKVLDKVKAYNFPGKPYDYFENNYKKFKKEKFFRMGIQGSIYNYGVDNNPQGYKKIQVSDILGDGWNIYKSEFVLPKYWHVLVTKENLEVLSKWRFGGDYPKIKLKVEQIVGFSSWEDKKGHNPKNFVEDFGVRITFDQFKQYVLKEPKQLTINDLVEGEIYLHDNSHIAKYPQGGCLTNTLWHNHKWEWNLDIKEVTPIQRKHWNCCNKQNKYIPESELDLYDDVTFELKNMKKSIKVEDLKYPDVVHCNSIDESNLINKYSKEGVQDYTQDRPYLLLEKMGSDSIPYDEHYNSYEFSDIIFPKEAKEFDRNWYVEVNSQEEVDALLNWLESQGEKVARSYSSEYNWKYVNCSVRTIKTRYWSRNHRIYEGTHKIQLSDILPNYISKTNLSELDQWIEANKNFKGTFEEFKIKLNSKKDTLISYELWKQLPGDANNTKAEYVWNIWNRNTYPYTSKEVIPLDREVVVQKEQPITLKKFNVPKI